VLSILFPFLDNVYLMLLLSLDDNLNDASVHRIIHYMNKKSKANFPFCPTCCKLRLTKQKFWSWFHSNNGSMRSPKPKSSLTPLHCKQHLKFSRKWREVIRNKKIRYCFLDEKWFYTRSNCNRLKILPLSMFEQPKDAHCHAPKVRSRQFPCKVMYMGIVERY
jgi:hypothetical protein